MNQNIGSADRVIRLVLGLVLIVLPLATGFAADALWLRWGALVIGVVLVGTAAIRSCPLYAMLGFNTCRRPS